METTEKKKTVMNPSLIKGTWQLTYKLVNDLGPNGFSGRMISSYRDPLTGKERFLMNADGRRLPGYFIENVVQNLNPENNPEHRDAIDWLVGHPAVGIENDQVKLDEKYLSRKDSNPRIKLVNLDHQNVVDIQEEDYIDKLIGAISQDEGPKAMSIEKVRFVLSKLNLEYREERLINNPAVEITKLKKRLKDFARRSYQNAKRVNQILDNLEGAKFEYEIKEMLRLDILTQNNGMYMYSGNPLGVSFESIIKYFNNNPEFYSELTQNLYSQLKSN
jgi:hypothetical protein